MQTILWHQHRQKTVTCSKCQHFLLQNRDIVKEEIKIRDNLEMQASNSQKILLVQYQICEDVKIDLSNEFGYLLFDLSFQTLPTMKRSYTNIVALLINNVTLD